MTLAEVETRYPDTPAVVDAQRAMAGLRLQLTRRGHPAPLCRGSFWPDIIAP